MRYRRRESGLWVPRHLQKPEAALQQAMVFGASTVPEAITTMAALLSWWDFEDNDAGNKFYDQHSGVYLLVKNASGAVATSAASTASGVEGRAFDPGGTEMAAYVQNDGGSNDLFGNSYAGQIGQASNSFGCWFNGTNVSGNTGYIIGRLLYLIVFAILAGLLYWLVGLLPIPEPFATIIKVAVVLVCILIVIGMMFCGISLPLLR